jgi:hypothetical protein
LDNTDLKSQPKAMHTPRIQKFTWLILTCTTFILISCQPVMMKIYGIKDPDVENNKSIRKKALKFGLDTTGIVTVKSEHFLSILSQYGIPDGSIYDSNGKYIEYRSTDTSCNAGLFDFIPALNLSAEYSQPQHITLSEEMSYYQDLHGNMFSDLPPSDYYLLLYWTVWTGKLNEDHVKVWEDLAKANKNCRIHVVKVNLDIQEHWPAEEREQIMTSMKKSKK